MKKFVQFYLGTDPEAKFFYSVEIHFSRKSMLRAIVNLKGKKEVDPEEKDTRAVCCRFVSVWPDTDPEKRRLQKKHQQLGTIFFFHGDMDSGVVLHELTHAAIGWARKARVNPFRPSRIWDQCPEEKFAATLQFMSRQFYRFSQRALTKAT